jgi:hypothetical protein
MKRKITFTLMLAICSMTMYAQTITWSWIDSWYNQSPTHTYEAAAQVYADGVTTSAPGSSNPIKAWLGYSSSDTDPSGSGWYWIPVSFNYVSGNNWQYQGKIIGLPEGTYYYAFRFQYLSEDYYYTYPSNNNKIINVDAWDTDITWKSVDTDGGNNPESITEGDDYPAAAQCFAEGVTTGNAVVPGSVITCEFGYSSSSSDPSATEGWTWTSIPYSSGSNNWNYSKSVSGIPQGDYTGAYRFRYKEKSYVYTTTTTFSVSATSGVENYEGKSTISLVDNLVKDGVLKIKLEGAVPGEYKLSVSDFSGRLIQTGKINASDGIHLLRLKSGDKGFYLLQLVGPDNSKKVIKFLLI